MINLKVEEKFTKAPHKIRRREFFSTCTEWCKKNVENYNQIISNMDYEKVWHEEELLWNGNGYPEVECLVNTGGNEGIFLDIFLTNRENSIRNLIASFKTLDENIDEYRYMGELSGILKVVIENYIWYNSQYIEND